MIFLGDALAMFEEGANLDALDDPEEDLTNEMV